jgi:hypothetical protein
VIGTAVVLSAFLWALVGVGFLIGWQIAPDHKPPACTAGVSSVARPGASAHMEWLPHGCAIYPKGSR